MLFKSVKPWRFYAPDNFGNIMTLIYVYNPCSIIISMLGYLPVYFKN